MKKLSHYRQVLLGIGMVATPAMVVAQAGPSPAATPQSASGEIVVTALKREASVLKVPAAISVLSGADLKAKGVNNLQDIQNLVPNVNIGTGRDGSTVAIRGVTTTDTSAKGEQDIAFNIDGVYVGRGNARTGAFFDVDRVEVLRGPQGTLYGRSSTGGAINVITVKPKLDEFSGYARLEYGNYDTKRAEGAVNIPLGDMFALRVSGNFNDRDGYSKTVDYNPTFNGVVYHFPANVARDRNDQRDATGRFSLLFQPSVDATFRLTATVGHQGGAGYSPANESQLEAHHDNGKAGLDILANPVPAYQDTNFANFDGSANIKFGGVQLDVLGSHQHLNYIQQGTAGSDVNANNGGTISPIFLLPPEPTFGPTFQFYLQQNRVNTTQFETRLSNVNPGKIDFVVGANYFDEKAGENGQSWNALINNPLDPSSYIFQAGPVNVTEHKAYGVFGQLTWNLTDRLALVGGARWTHDEVNRVGVFTLPFNFSAGFPPPPYPDSNGNPICHYPDACAGAPNNAGASDSKVTWKAGVNFQLNNSNLLYASVSTGFKGGGFNDYDPATGGIGKYGPSSLTAYEAGYKGHPIRNLTLSSSLFYYDFSHDQITSGVYFGNIFVIYTQLVPVKIYGWENEATYALGKSTSLSGSFSILHSRFGQFNAGQYAFEGDPVSFTHRALDQSPTFTATAALDRVFHIDGDNDLRFRVATKYSNGYYVSDFGNAVRWWQPSFTRTNLSLTYEREAGRYYLQLFVENVEDKVQRIAGPAQYTGAYGGQGGYTPAGATLPVPGNGKPSALPANYVTVPVTTPRFFGVRLGMKF